MKKCKKGSYYCYTDKKCKPIPKGFKVVGPAGYLRKENGHTQDDDSKNGKKNGSVSGGNGNGNGGNGNGGHSSGSNGSNGGGMSEESNPRIPRKKGQPANSKKHSDLYTDENPKGTIHGLGFKDVSTAKASVSKIRNSSRSHAHKIQAAVAMEQRAKEMGKSSEAAVYRKYINSMKKKTDKMNEGWSDKYKKSIDCNNPKGFSQRAHCQGKKKTFKEFMGDI
tara:strand:- start:5055 stop:5720 length:666 start_codon:yes stop_codon:yes gene_type:complete